MLTRDQMREIMINAALTRRYDERLARTGSKVKQKLAEMGLSIDRPHVEADVDAMIEALTKAGD